MRSADAATGAGISFEPTSEQHALRELAHEFAERELRPIAREWDDREDCPPELLGKAAALGLTSHAIPVEYGGGGVSAVTSSLIAEELSWGCAGLVRPDRRDDVPGAAAAALRHRGAEAALAAAARFH